MIKIHRTLAFFIFSLLMIACASTGIQHTKDGTRIFNKSSESIKDKSIIEGTVQDASSGKGIRGARVEIKNANMGIGYYLRETDMRGYFRIDDFIPHNRYKIEVSCEGYVSYSTIEDIKPGTHIIRMNREARLIGIVKNSAGQSIEGVEIKLKKASYEESSDIDRPLIQVTKADGSYQFSKLLSGSYIISFSKPGYISETAQLKNIKTSETFSLPMVLLAPASISGRVLIEGIKTPAINVNISAQSNVTYGSATYQDGTYRLEDMKPGNYRITISHQGFYNFQSQIIALREGEQKKDLSFIIKPREPQIKINAYRYTFAPGNKVEFNIRTLRLDSVNVTIYKVPINLLLKGGKDPALLDPEKEGFKTISQWEEPVREFLPFEWRYQAIELKSNLPTGGYCIEVRGADSIYTRKFFSVTTVGILLKRTQDSIFAYVSNLADNTPISNATVVIYDTTPKIDRKTKKQLTYAPPENIEDLPITIIHKGATDKTGLFHKKFRSQKYLSALVVDNDGSYAICNSGSPSTFEREQTKYFVYTDRPVYRAGDTVNYKIIGKERNKHFTPIPGQVIHFQIINLDMDKVVDNGTIRLDDWGTANGKIKIPSDENLGEYEIQVGPSTDNLYAKGKFYVEQYRKPEYKIDITPTKDFFVNNDTIEFKIEAKYFFGAPLKGALIQYRFYENALKDEDANYWWEEESGNQSYYSKIKLEGEKYADNDGIAVLRLQAGNYPYDREITLEATIIDKSNASVTSSGRVRVGRGEYYIKIMPCQNFFSATEKKEIQFKTLTQTGNPVSRKLKVEIFRYIWKPFQRVYVHEDKPVYSEKISTDSKGNALLHLPVNFNLNGEFDIVATSVDSRDNVISASRVIWIYSPAGGLAASHFKNLELSIDKTVLTSPEEITCLVKSRYTDAFVCLTLEGRDVYETKVIEMTGNIMPVRFKIKPEYAPNFFVTASMQRKRALYTCSENISLPVADTGLNISISPDKALYKPGDLATIRLSVTDSKGKPITADLSLAAVDESIYYIRHDHTPKMQEYFYTKISNWVMTSYSYPITLLAGAAKEDKVKVREKFEDTAFWKANITTNAEGKATVSFPLPDNLTTWRLTARGHDKNGRMGEIKNTFLVSQDLIARIGKPRFMVSGDSVGLIGIINSNTNRGLTGISTELKVNDQILSPDERKSISLPAYGSASSYYSFSIPFNKTKAELQFTARGDKHAKDAIKISIPIEKRGSIYNLFGYGDVKNSAVLTSLKNSDDFTFYPESITISISPSPIIQMTRAVRYLSEYPYGCIEQTLNRFVPNLALYRVAHKKNLIQYLDEESITNLDSKIKSGIEMIQGQQNDDGTWGWWAGARGNGSITGYVLYSLHLVKESGYQIDTETIKRGLDAIRGILANPKLAVSEDEYAYLLYIYALWGRWDQNAFETIQKYRNQNAYIRAFSIRALSAAKRNNRLPAALSDKYALMIQQNVNVLNANMKRDAFGPYWTSSSYQKWGWPGGDVEMTAHVLSAYIDIAQNRTMVSQLVHSISKRFRGNSWNSTKETATVLFAFCNYIDVWNVNPAGKGNYKFSIDNTPLVEMSYDLNMRSKPSDFQKRISFTPKESRNSYTITMEGDISSDVLFDATMKGYMIFKENKIPTMLRSEGKSIKALNNGLNLTRSFSSLQRVKDLQRNEYLVPQTLSDKRVLRIGDELLVKLKFVAEDDLQYLVLEDYLPSGFEIIRKNAYDNYTPYIHAESWDNRMVYFFSNIQKGQLYEIAYIVRAELPGSFIARPSNVKCMYEPTLQGWSEPIILEIRKK